VYASILRRLTITGLRRGMGGSRGWLYLGITAVGLRAIRRMAMPDDEVLYRTAIRAGDVFEIVTRKRPK
jgi:hypothetical protein